LKISFYLIIGKKGENVWESRLNELIAGTASSFLTLFSINNGYEVNYEIIVDLELWSDKLLAIECDFIKILLVRLLALLLFFVNIGWFVLSCGDNEKLVLVFFAILLDCLI